MADTIDLRLLDKRTAERYIQQGLLNEKDWEKHLKSLEDVSEKGTVIETMMGDEEDLYDDEDEDLDEEQGEQA